MAPLGLEESLHQSHVLLKQGEVPSSVSADDEEMHRSRDKPEINTLITR